MIWLIMIGYSLYSTNMIVGVIGAMGFAYAIWDRQNWLARKNGTHGETGWVKTSDFDKVDK